MQTEQCLVVKLSSGFGSRWWWVARRGGTNDWSGSNHSLAPSIGWLRTRSQKEPQHPEVPGWRSLLYQFCSSVISVRPALAVRDVNAPAAYDRFTLPRHEWSSTRPTKKPVRQRKFCCCRCCYCCRTRVCVCVYPVRVLTLHIPQYKFHYGRQCTH